MKRVFKIMLAALFLTGCGLISGSNPSDSSQQSKDYRQIDMDEAIAIMNSQSGYIILDVRRVDEFSAGHIPGAINIPNESIGNEEISALPDKDQLILVYCRSGNRSKQASEKLAALGYTNIVEFGGILDWPGETVPADL